MDRSDLSRHRSKDFGRSNLNIFANRCDLDRNEYFNSVTTESCNLIKIESILYVKKIKNF